MKHFLRIWFSIRRGKVFTKRTDRNSYAFDCFDMRASDLWVIYILWNVRSEDTGICFVETSNLDGETNLKIRQSLPVTSNITAEDVLSIKGYIECEEPNRFLYEFLGKLSVDGGKS